MRYKIIAIEREYASGGREIGEKLAKRLNIPCYGQEILDKAAEKLHMPREILAQAEETITGSLLFGMVSISNINTGNMEDLLRTEQKLAIAEAEVIRELALESCVLVGRRAAALLKDDPATLRVFIRSNDADRKRRAIEIYGADPKEVVSVLHRFDKRRASYFKATTIVEWKEPEVYHLFINSGCLGIDRTVDILYEAVK